MASGPLVLTVVDGVLQAGFGGAFGLTSAMGVPSVKNTPWSMENAKVVTKQPVLGQEPSPVASYQAVASVFPDPGHTVKELFQLIVPWLSQNTNL
jgi:hypothetical protein